MKISAKHRKMIVDEFDYVLKNMKKEKDFFLKNFYLSALHGMLGRISYLENDPQLVFIRTVLNATYDGLQGNLLQAMAGRPVPPPPSEKLYSTLVNYLTQMRNQIKDKKDDEIYSSLEKIIYLLDSTSGGGYYLLQKGLKKI